MTTNHAGGILGTLQIHDPNSLSLLLSRDEGGERRGDEGWEVVGRKR